MRFLKIIPKAMAVAIFAAGSTFGHAATVDFTELTLDVGLNSTATVAKDFATLLGTASLSGSVTYLKSFEWQFTAGDVYVDVVNDYSYLTLSSGTVTLADIQSVGDFGTSGWKTYAFNDVYSGSIIFGVANAGDDELGSTLELRNAMLMPPVSPVPEPQSFAMLLAGFGMVGVVMRRRKPSGTQRTRYSVRLETNV